MKNSSKSQDRKKHKSELWADGCKAGKANFFLFPSSVLHRRVRDSSTSYIIYGYQKFQSHFPAAQVIMVR